MRMWGSPLDSRHTFYLLYCRRVFLRRRRFYGNIFSFFRQMLFSFRHRVEFTPFWRLEPAHHTQKSHNICIKMMANDVCASVQQNISHSTSAHAHSMYIQVRSLVVSLTLLFCDSMADSRCMCDWMLDVAIELYCRIHCTQNRRSASFARLAIAWYSCKIHFGRALMQHPNPHVWWAISIHHIPSCVLSIRCSLRHPFLHCNDAVVGEWKSSQWQHRTHTTNILSTYGVHEAINRLLVSSGKLFTVVCWELIFSRLLSSMRVVGAAIKWRSVCSVSVCIVTMTTLNIEYVEVDKT